MSDLVLSHSLDQIRFEITEIQQSMATLRADHEREIKALQARIATLEKSPTMAERSSSSPVIESAMATRSAQDYN